MAGPLTIARRTLPPAFVLFLFVDLVVNPYIPRLGTVAAGAKQNGRLTVDESRALLDRSQKLVIAGKDEAALEPALKLYGAYPENHIYSQTLAQIYHRLGNYREEAEYWEKFVEHAPLPMEACPQIGHAYWNQKRYPEAISALDKCLTFDPEDHDTLFALGHAHERMGHAAQAAKVYGKELALDPHNKDCQTGLARVKMRMGRMEEARKLVKDVLRQSPQNVDALLVAGLIALSAGEVAPAKRYLLQGVALSPRYTDYYLALARIEESEGRYREAAARYDRVLELDPDNADAARRRGAIGRGRR